MDEEREGQESRALVPIEVSAPVAVLPQQHEISIMGTLAKSVVLARGHAVPASIDSVAKAFAVMLAGWEVGAKPMTALRHFFVINGRTEPDAQLMMGIVKARDPSARFEFHTRSVDLCDVELFRAGRSVVRIAYTKADAERAGLLKKGGPWTQYRTDMMSWAAVKRACRLGAPDLINAISGVDVGEAQELMGPEGEMEAVPLASLPAETLTNPGDEPPAEEPAPEPEPEPEPEEAATQGSGPGATVRQVNTLRKLVMEKGGGLEWYSEKFGERLPPDLSPAEASQAIDQLMKMPAKEGQQRMEEAPPPEEPPVE